VNGGRDAAMWQFDPDGAAIERPIGATTGLWVADRVE
jgi:hypothetical protein